MGKRQEGLCLECGEVLTGTQRRWCSSACASRVYGRARNIALEAFAPRNRSCLACNRQVEPGKWYCGPDCRDDYRATGKTTPSRYDRPEFFDANYLDTMNGAKKRTNQEEARMSLGLYGLDENGEPVRGHDLIVRALCRSKQRP